MINSTVKYLLVLSLFLTGELFAQLPRQKVVMEEGTGTW